MRRRLPAATAAWLLLFAGTAWSAPAQLYKYRGADGTWIFTDRPTQDAAELEVRELSRASRAGRVTVSRRVADGRLVLSARNPLPAPVQFRLRLDELENVELPPSDMPREYLLPAESTVEVAAFDTMPGTAGPGVDYGYLWMIGDPGAEHRPERPYRAPFSLAVGYRVSQAWPDVQTHVTPDSHHAVDIAMPIGSRVHAARGGVVVEIADGNFRNSDLPDWEAARANLVRILHDDGTFGVYAHLHWNSLRVRPGERVERGQYLADSGNSGFSRGPHLHFVVLRNAGMRLESVPVEFAGLDGTPVTAQAGTELVAY